MSVASHLGIRLGEYDRRIRTFIPRYDALLTATASAVALARRRTPRLLDLGTGTGALAARCLALRPGARLTGMDADGDILALARRRLARCAEGVQLVTGRFDREPLPAADVIVATLALHHIRTVAAKRRFYARCRAALSRGGVLASGDCMPPGDAAAAAAARAAWSAHLRRHYSPRQVRGYFAAWAEEDRYLPLATELALLAEAGFRPEVLWRHGCFAVVAGRRR